jgi:hypothetical protein
VSKAGSDRIDYLLRDSLHAGAGGGAMKRLQRESVIIQLAEQLRAHGSWRGETNIQKATYFLESSSIRSVNSTSSSIATGPSRSRRASQPEGSIKGSIPTARCESCK